MLENVYKPLGYFRDFTVLDIDMINCGDFLSMGVSFNHVHPWDIFNSVESSLFTCCLGLKLKIVECIERKSQTVVDNSKCIDEDEPADVACKKDSCVPGMYVFEKYELCFTQ